MMFNVVLLALLASTPVEVAAKIQKKDDPIQKVLVLIKEIMAKVEGDGKAEQKTYDKFACWCEKTLARKAASIDAAKETIDVTQREVIELKGKLGELGATIKQLSKEIAENEAARKEATEIREKENADYTQERTEAEQCIGALESAVKVLSGAGTKKAMLQTLQEAQVLSVVGGVKHVLQRMPDSDALSEINENDLNLVKDFVENPTKFVSTGFSGAQIGAKSSNPFGDYAPASTQITGILKGMYDGMVADLEKASAEEADKQKTYEELMATKEAEHKTLTATLEEKTKEDADAKKKVADDKVLLEDTKTQLEADETFFAETKANCKAKANEWAEVCRLRTEELQGMAKAIEILEGGAFTQFQASTTSFVQVSSKVMDRVMDQRRAAAFSKLKALMKNGGGLKIAMLAAALRSGGHFDKVIIMIDKMIADLRAEEQEDIKKRDDCNNQENALKAQEEDLNYNIEKKEKLKERQEAKKAEVTSTITAKEDEIMMAQQTMDEMLAGRNEETANFKKAMKDGAAEAALLGSAIESLTAFYTNNKIPLALAQESVAEEPKYTIDEDKAPDAKFSSGARKSESKGIIAILGLMKQDVENSMKEAQAEEAAAQKEFEKLKAESQDGLDTMKATVTSLKQEEADLDGKIAETSGQVENHNDQKQATLGEKKALEPSCSWVKSNFDGRREKRKGEIAGLEEAKSMLAGARPELLQGSFHSEGNAPHTGAKVASELEFDLESMDFMKEAKSMLTGAQPELHQGSFLQLKK